MKAPKYGLHKPSGQARVYINGKPIYLGKYGSPESRHRYREEIERWQARRIGLEFPDLRVGELIDQFRDYAREYYRKGGRPTSEISIIDKALSYLSRDDDQILVESFGPKRLSIARDRMIAAGLARKTINAYVDRIRRMFSWGVSQEFVPVVVLTALRTLAGLKAGRTRARETEPVKPVADELVDATLPHLPPIVAAMVRLQRLTGMRPNEVCIMRPCDITISMRGAWLYRPSEHKLEHKNLERRVYLGPQAQEILRPYMERDSEAFCFSPKQAEAERRTLPPGRKSRAKASPKRPPCERYTVASYRRAVSRGCEVAFGMPEALRVIPKGPASTESACLTRDAKAWRAKHCWAPNQLRHTAATTIRERFGIEAAQTALGHTDPRTTQIYAERNFGLAASVAEQVG